MRVAFVSNTVAFVLSPRMPLALALKERGFDIHIIAPESQASVKLEQHGFTFHPLVLHRLSMRPWTEARTIGALAALYRKLRPDVVHHLTIKPVIYGTVAARLCHVPAVVNAITGRGSVFVTRGPRAAAIRFAVTSAYQLALRHPRSRMIFQNPEDRALFIEQGLVDEQTTVLIRGSGVQIEQFVPTAEPSGVPIVMFAGRMLWQKGVRDFVAAAEIVRRRGKSARFVLCGDADPDNPSGVPRAQLQEWAARGVVEWWGHRDDMPTVLASSNIVCLPSAYGEGVPKVLLEAAACARPIVTTDTPGCREIVRDGVNGLLVPIRAPERLADAIVSLVDSPERRAAMGARGREIARTEFTVEQVVSATLDVYRSLIGAPARDAATTPSS